jgi:hypothetical protein
MALRTHPPPVDRGPWETAVRMIWQALAAMVVIWLLIGQYHGI